MIPRPDVRLLGVYRELEYSPGRHASNNAIILRRVGQALERAGAAVDLVSLDDARTRWSDATLIFSMCQGPAALAELARWQAQGALILNGPDASRRTYRDQLCPLLCRDGIPFPRSLFVSTNGTSDHAAYHALFPAGRVWMKRMDVHATCPDDVVGIENWSELEHALAAFHRRGLDEIVLQEHRPGDEVKFYGVFGTTFFWHFYPCRHEGYPFSADALQCVAERAAAEVGVGIYGGDAIVAPDGSLSVIDLNDWPSFAPCCDHAAEAIASYILARARRDAPVVQVPGASLA